MDISLSFHPVTKPLSTVGKWGVSRRARWHEGNRWRGLSCKSTIPRRRRGVSERRGAPNLGAGVIFRGGDLRSGGEGKGWRRTAATPGPPSHLRLSLPPPCPSPSPGCALPLAAACISVTPAAEGCGGGERTAWPPGARSAGDAAVAPRGGGSKSAPGPGSSRRRRRRSRLGRWQPLRARPNPGRRGYLILDVLLPPLGSDVRGEVLGELHPAVSPSLPPGSGSYRRRRRRQQRLRLLPTWAPALRGAALLSSSAAAEVSSEPPSRHLPPPLHSPAPPRPPDVIAMVTAYAAWREGAGYGAGPRGGFPPCSASLGRTW